VFERGSRYADVSERIYEFGGRRRVAYKVLRLIPPLSPSFESHAVVEGDRLDLLAYRYLRDPERFWRICDENLAVRPDDLVTEPGRRLRIPSELV
jgi:hypothetical protein